MRLLTAFLTMLLAVGLFSSGVFSSCKRLKQHEAGQLMQVQARRSSPPLNARAHDSSGGGSSGHHSYGLPGIGRAMASPDEAAMAAVEEGVLGNQRRYGGLKRPAWPGSATNEALGSSDALPEHSSMPVPSAQELTEVFGLMDTNRNHGLSPQELQNGMEQFGSPLSNADTEKLFKLADRNRDGRIDAAEFVAAVEAKAANSILSEIVKEHPPQLVEPGEMGDTFEQGAKLMINSLIARDIQEYKTRQPKWSAFMQKLQQEGVHGYSASDVFLGAYKLCGNSHIGAHEKCIFDKVRPFISYNGEDIQCWKIFIHMVFPEMERLIQALLNTLK